MGPNNLILGPGVLPVCGTLGEERLDEESAKPVQGSLEVGRGHVEVVVGVAAGGVGVGAAPVVRQVLGVLVLVRVRLCAHEQHVLAEVGQSRELYRVGHVPAIREKIE